MTIWKLSRKIRAGRLGIDQIQKQNFQLERAHAQFMARQQEWFVPGDSGFLVCWWVHDGYLPTVAEAMSHWRDVQTHGETEKVFGANMLAEFARREAA